MEGIVPELSFETLSGLDFQVRELAEEATGGTDCDPRITG